MKLPPLQGICDQKHFFIYAACDQTYFDEFAPAFVNSIRANTHINIHIHIFNPRPDQLNFCQQHKVSVTWEYVPLDLFVTATARWQQVPKNEPELSRYNRTLTAMSKGSDIEIIQRLQKTYFACARFIRLAELYQQVPVLAIDIDAVIRQPIPELSAKQDFYIHHVAGRRARYLAGGLWLNSCKSCQEFLTVYSQELQSWFERDHVYWGLDQDLLDTVVPQFRHGQLPMEYIDWNMQDHSYIWTAKGTRKNSHMFIQAQKQYTV